MNAHDEVMKDIVEDPKKYGAPSFEDFCKDPDSYTKALDDVLAATDDSLKSHRQLLRRQKYFYEGYECRTLEEVEKCALNDGINTKEDLDCLPQWVDVVGGEFDLYVKFQRKAKVGV